MADFLNDIKYDHDIKPDISENHKPSEENEQFPTSICQSTNSLKNDLKEYRTGQKSYICNFCQKAFLTKTILNKHILTHTSQKRYVCEVCDKAFTYKNNFIVHSRIHTGEKPFVCSECHKRFRQKQNLQTHLKIHTDHKPPVCNFCQKTFRFNYALTKHLRVHAHEEHCKCSTCRMQRSKEKKLDVHSRRIHAKPFECNVCQKAYTRCDSLKKHFQMHTSGKPVTCDVCQKVFMSAALFKKHPCFLTGTDPSLRPVYRQKFFAENCLNLQLPIQSNEKSHENRKKVAERKHLNEYLIQLNEEPCGNKKTVAKKEHLNECPIYSDEKPLCKTECSSQSRSTENLGDIDEQISQKDFSVNDSVKGHLIDADMKPYVCYTCQIAFSEQNIFNDHILTHT